MGTVVNPAVCAACGELTALSPCTICGGNPLLQGVWRLDRVLGRGASGTTYAGTRQTDGRCFALKELRELRLPKQRDLAEREARILSELHHAQLPRFEDSFVGLQMGWDLRPFVGNPELGVTFFRDEIGNAWIEVPRVLWEALLALAG